jgi:hypothetical protein
MSQLDFHIRHEVTPERCWTVLSALDAGEDYGHVVQAERQLSRLRQLDLLAGQALSPQLTKLGKTVVEVGQKNPKLTFDLLHYLHYTRWTSTRPHLNSAFWSYQSYCHLLYDRQECALDQSFKEQIANELDIQIRSSAFFGPYVQQKTRKGVVSISPNTLNGIQHWLAALTPPVILADTFSLRDFCPPGLLLLAIGHVYTSDDTEAGLELLLTPQKRTVLCRVGLLNPQALDRSLDWMLPLYSQIVQPGTRTGSYGRSIRLLRIPTMKDIPI